MKSGLGRTLFGGVLVAAAFIAPGRVAHAGNCVLYARSQTGVSLYGAAGGWWDEAAGLYQRGHVPEVGSILVFRRTGHMRSGHVAIVSKVIGPGQILVDQSNWYHGRITRDTPVIDTSPGHDWTQVAVMNIGSGEFGRDSPTFGFVYPETGSPGVVALRGSGGFDPGLAREAAYEPEAGSQLFHFAVAGDGWHGRVHYRRSARFSGHRRYASRWARHERRSAHRSTRHRHPMHLARDDRHSSHASTARHAGHGSIHAARHRADRTTHRRV